MLHEDCSLQCSCCLRSLNRLSLASHSLALVSRPERPASPAAAGPTVFLACQPKIQPAGLGSLDGSRLGRSGDRRILGVDGGRARARGDCQRLARCGATGRLIGLCCCSLLLLPAPSLPFRPHPFIRTANSTSSSSPPLHPHSTLFLPRAAPAAHPLAPPGRSQSSRSTPTF